MKRYIYKFYIKNNGHSVLSRHFNQLSAYLWNRTLILISRNNYFLRVPCWLNSIKYLHRGCLFISIVYQVTLRKLYFERNATVTFSLKQMPFISVSFRLLKFLMQILTVWILYKNTSLAIEVKIYTTYLWSALSLEGL